MSTEQFCERCGEPFEGDPETPCPKCFGCNEAHDDGNFASRLCDGFEMLEVDADE